MKVRPQCIPCIYGVRAREILESDLDDAAKVEALAGLARVLSEVATPEASTVEVAWRCFRYVKGTLGTEDPYAEYKRRSNEVARRFLESLASELERLSGYERFRTLLLASVVANSLDPGVPSYERAELGGLPRGFEADDTRTIYDILGSSQSVVYLLDNAGEAVVDLAVVKEMRSMGVEVVVVTKSAPYQNDVTVEEALTIGFGKYARVLGTGNDYGAVSYPMLPDEVKAVIRDADLVIAKGMANYEAALYSPPPARVAHLLRAKCEPVASSLGVRVGALVARIIDWREAPTP